MAIWVLIAAVAVAMLAVGIRVWFRFRGLRVAPCPVLGRDVAIEVDALRAGFAAALGGEELAIRRCSLWPACAGCGDLCIDPIRFAPSAGRLSALLRERDRSEACVLCGERPRASASGPWPAALQRPDGRTVAWRELPLSQVPSALASYPPVCRRCHESMRFATAVSRTDASISHMPWLLVPILAVWLCFPRPAPAEDLQPGTELGQQTAEAARDLLPPEILAHYAAGEYRNTIVSWPEGTFERGEAFRKATEENRGRYRVDERGTIVDGEGRQPPFVYGVPFPDVDPDDPAAGIKIVWNYFYGLWSNGSYHNVVDLAWISPSGVDRTATQDVHFLYYDGVPSAWRPAKNPLNLSMQFLASALAPADLYGTAALTWRYRDSTKRDSSWAYVPALRRVRAVSPANRSDGFLGSDMSQDDGPFFDGKPEEFTWTLVGEREALRLVDPWRVTGEHREEAIPGGGWRVLYRDLPVVGMQAPDRGLLPWAPVSHALARRRFWVVEAVPKDRYYLYGKIELWLDRETYQGAWSRKYNWQGELLNTLQSAAGPTATPDGVHYFDLHVGGNIFCQIGENIKLRRATVAMFDAKHVVDEVAIPIDPAFFDYQSLYRFGK